MASGCFPLYKNEKDVDKLVEAIRLIDEFVDSWYSAVYNGDSGGNQFDNAASDGGALALISLASSLLKDQIRS